MANANSNGSRAVLYLRMSSDHQETSIPDQRTELTKHARTHGYSIVREYLDEAISGDATERRTGFLTMRDAATSGEFDLVLAWDQDRFGRFDPLDAGYWIYPFRRAGVRLETIAQGRIDWEDLTGQLVYSVNQLAKAQYLRDLSRNVTRGLTTAAREGRSGTGGRYPYGYRSANGEVWIEPSEAAVVRWIFETYVQRDQSLRSLAAELIRRQTRSPSGRPWRAEALAGILRRRKYTGAFTWGIRAAGRYFSMRDGEVVPRSKSDQLEFKAPIVHEGKFEAIVSQALYDAAQRKLAKNQKWTAPSSCRQYLLTGLIRCGNCGGAMGGETRRNESSYCCRTYRRGGKAVCGNNKIREAPLVSCVVRKIQEQYTSKAALARLRRALEAEVDQEKPRPRDLTRLRKEIEALDHKIDHAETAVLEAPPEVRVGLYRKLQQLTADRDRLKSELDSLEARTTQPSRRNDSEIDEAINALRTLGTALAAAEPAEARELLAGFVSKIELHFTHTEHGQQTHSEFSHGIVYVRPLLGSSHLSDTPRRCWPTACGSA